LSLVMNMAEVISKSFQIALNGMRRITASTSYARLDG